MGSYITGWLGARGDSQATTLWIGSCARAGITHVSTTRHPRFFSNRQAIGSRPRRMRTLLSFAFLAASLVHLHANSYLFTLEQKVAACTAIVRVSVTEATAPQTKSPLDPAVCNARVLEVLKGPSDLKEVEFRFSAYGSFSRDTLPQMVGKEFIVFLHETFE